SPAPRSIRARPRPAGRRGRPRRRAASAGSAATRPVPGPDVMSGRRPLAVALRYEAPHAPKVVAVGRGALGERIVETARAHGVPLETNAPLAEALAGVEVETEIPIELYEAMAVILAFILRAARPAPGLRP